MEPKVAELSEHFTYRKLFRYIFPSAVMMVISSIYYVVDGFFVSNFVGKLSFAAANFIYPVLMLMSAVGFMFGSGGSALIAKTLGEKNREKANSIFSMLMYASLICGCAVAILGILFVRPLAVFLGAEGQMLEDGILYGRICMLGIPASIMQFEYQYLCATANKPKLGMYVTVAAGVSNIVLDALFVAVFSWGLAGAAVASVLSQCVGGFVPLLYFSRKNTSLLQIKKAKFDRHSFTKICTNGSSELLNNIAMSLVGMLYNAQFLRYVGEDGVAAYGVLMYVGFVFIAIFIGYVVGVSPLISYQYGAQNHCELQNLVKKSLRILGITSLGMFIAGELMSGPLSRLYVSYDPKLLEFTMRGFRIYSFSFLFSGFAIWGPSFFTALNNGLVSAVLSFFRTFLFQVVAVLLLPLVLDVDGIWLSIPIAELAAALLGFAFIAAYRKKYHY